MSTENPSSPPKLALIAGPTASGKSALALDLAERIGGTIINADASQVYAELRILSARPSVEEEARVPHLLYGYRSGATACSAATWARDAEAAIDRVVATGGRPILVGGTGLYIRTLLDGIAPVPEVDPEIRAAVRALATPSAYAALGREDAAAAARLHANDTARIQRALEVARSTGRSILAWRAERQGGVRYRFDLDIRTIDPEIGELYRHCDARVDQMMAAGAVEEVAALVGRDFDHALPVMRAIGVEQLATYLGGGSTLSAAVAAMKQATRNYAKRQRTWLRHQL